MTRIITIRMTGGGLAEIEIPADMSDAEGLEWAASDREYERRCQCDRRRIAMLYGPEYVGMKVS